MPDFNVDVDVDEFISSCSRGEIREIIDILVENGDIARDSGYEAVAKSVLDEIWEDGINRLKCMRLAISNEDEEIIKSIIRKYDCSYIG